MAYGRAALLIPTTGSEPGSESDSSRANRVLLADEVAVVIVAPNRLTEVRTEVDPELRHRVKTW